MKFLFAAASAVLATAAVPAVVQAQETTLGAYAGANYSHAHGDDADLGALQGKLGYRFHPNFGVEGELGFGVKSDKFDITPGVRAKAQLKHQEAIYGVGFLPVSPNTDIIARVGYGNSRVKVSAAGVSASDNLESWNYGVGASTTSTGVNGIRADYTRHDFTGGGNGHADVWSVGYTRRF